MNGKYYVVCGNRNEFNEFIKRKAFELFGQGNTSISLSQFVHVDSVDKIRGIHEPTGWFYGTWRERSDIKNILKVLMVCSTTKNDMINDLYWELCE